MRIEIRRGREPRGLCDYLTREDKREPGRQQEDPIIHTNMLCADAEQLAEELRFSSDLNPRVQKSIAHYAISFPPGEDPTLKVKQQIIDDLLDGMGHKDCQFFAVEHYERIHKNDVHHLHIATSTIDLDGNWVDDAFDWLKAKNLERELELKYGLQYCPPRDLSERRNLTSGESRQEERTGQPCAKRQLWEVIDQAVEDTPSMPLLIARIKAQGYSVRFAEFEDGGKGVSFGAGDKFFKGRDLGAKYSFEGLQKYTAIDYQPERDDTLLRDLNQMNATQCQQLTESQRLEIEEVETYDYRSSPEYAAFKQQLPRYFFKKANEQQQRAEALGPILLELLEAADCTELNIPYSSYSLSIAGDHQIELSIGDATVATLGQTDNSWQVTTGKLGEDHLQSLFLHHRDFLDSIKNLKELREKLVQNPSKNAHSVLSNAELIEEFNQVFVGLEPLTLPQKEIEQEKVLVSPLQTEESVEQELVEVETEQEESEVETASQTQQTEEAEELQPIDPQSAQWLRATTLLDYTASRMENAEINGEKYQGQWTELTLSVLQKAPERVIAQGRYNVDSQSWEVLQSRISAENWADFNLSKTDINQEESLLRKQDNQVR